MTPAYTVDEVRSRLSEWVGREGYRKVAEVCGVTEQYIRAVLAPKSSNQRRPPSERIAKAMGLTPAYVDIP